MKMKINKSKTTLLSLAATLVFCLLFSSCSAIEGYSEPEDSLIAMAVGFDAEGDKISVSVQVSDGGDEGRALSGEGENIFSALARIGASESKKIEYSHVAAIVLGRGINAEWFGKIMDFCRESEEISVSAHVVSSTDASALLSPDGFGGYEILSMLSSGVGENFSAEGRVYRLFGATENVDAAAIPHFAHNGESFELYGVKVYQNGEGKVILARSEAELFLMMRGDFKGARTRYELIKGEADALRVTLEIDGEIASADAFPRLENEVSRLYSEIFSRHGDLFGYVEEAKKLGADSENLSVEFKCKDGGK
jgi:hypothetical protein